MVNFAVSGCGAFVEKAVLPLMKEVKNARPIAACGGRDLEKVKRVCGKFNIPHICETFEYMLQIDEVDAVYVASPNVFHKEQTIAAARAGKHILCEKPMAMNVAECREMIAACNEHKVKLAIGFCYPLAGSQQKVKEMIKAGSIGDVSYMHFSFNLGGYNPETVTWRCDPRLSGGGPLMDVAVHLVNLGCFFLDDEVESVMAYVRPEKTEEAVELDTVSMLEFKRGVRAVMDCSFVRGNRHNYIIAGSEGEIHAMGTMQWNAGGKLVLRARGKEEEVSFPLYEHIARQIQLFCRAIEGDEEVPFSGKDGLHVQAVIEAIYESGRSGGRRMVRH